MALEIAALLVSVVALVVSVGAIMWQTRQGQRVGMSVISTADQIYRHIKQTDPDDILESDPILGATCSPLFIKAKEQMTLTLNCFSVNEFFGTLKVSCLVERPSGASDRLLRDVFASRQINIQLQVVYPSHDFPGSTVEPGRYHVRWQVVDEYVLRTVGTDEEETRREYLGSAEAAFGVMP